MNKEIRLIFFTLSCLIYKIVAMTTTVPPDYQERLLQQKELGKLCGRCGQQDLSSTCLAPYKDSCTEYIQCKQIDGPRGTLIWTGTKMSCSHGTFYSRIENGCYKPQEANCETDKCYVDRNVLSIESYASSSGCRTYWRCAGEGENRMSIPECCGVDQAYDEQLKACVQDVTCTETCYLDASSTTCKNKTRWGPKCENNCPINCKDGQCDAWDGKCSYCKPGWTGIRCEFECTHDTFACAPGTVFSKATCTCEAIKKVIETQPHTDCVPMVFVDFSPKKSAYDLNQVNGQVPVFNSEIEINSKSETNHEGNFNGNSSAKIWALNGNTDMTNDFAARIQFMQSGQGMGNQTLLSNCMNSEDDAAIHIVLLTTQNLIEISVITEKQEKALPLKLPKERFTLSYQNGKWNILELIIRRKQIWARVTDKDGTTNDINGKMDSKMTTGQTMQVGKCKKVHGFVGFISEFSILTCDPRWYNEKAPIVSSSTVP